MPMACSLVTEAVVDVQGEHANRIWNLIYSQSCFTNITDSCTERRIFHRLISGLALFLNTLPVWREPVRPAVAA